MSESLTVAPVVGDTIIIRQEAHSIVSRNEVRVLLNEVCRMFVSLTQIRLYDVESHPSRYPRVFR